MKGRVVNVEPITGCKKVTVLYKNGHRRVINTHKSKDPSKNSKTYNAAVRWEEAPAKLKKELSASMQSNIDDELKRRQKKKVQSSLIKDLNNVKHEQKIATKKNAQKKAQKERRELRTLANSITTSDPWSGYKSKAQRKAETISINKKLEKDNPSMNPWGDYKSKSQRKAEKKSAAVKKHIQSQLHSDAREQLINKDIPKLAPNATKKQIEEGIDYLFKVKVKRNPDYTYYRLLMQKEVLKLVADIINNPNTRREYKQYIKREFNNDD